MIEENENKKATKLPKQPSVEHTCEYCGKIYFRVFSQDKRLKNGSKFCSRQCMGLSKRKNNRYKKVKVIEPLPIDENTMLDKELYQKISIATGMTKTVVERVITSMFAQIRLAVKEDKKVSLPKFMTFMPMSSRTIFSGNYKKNLMEKEQYYMKADFAEIYNKSIFSNRNKLYINDTVKTLIGEDELTEVNVKEAVAALNNKFIITKKIKKEMVGNKKGNGLFNQKHAAIVASERIDGGEI